VKDRADEVFYVLPIHEVVLGRSKSNQIKHGTEAVQTKVVKILQTQARKQISLVRDDAR